MFRSHTAQHDSALCQHPGTLVLKSNVCLGAAQTFAQPATPSTLNTKAVHAGARQPFKFLLCGDPSLVAAFRSLLLAGTGGDTVPLDAVAALETIAPGGARVDLTDARAVLFFGIPADRPGAPVDALTALKLPVFAVLVDAEATATSGPAQAPAAGAIEDYIVPAIEFECLRARLLPHLVDVCKNVEIAVGRRLPILRTTVAAKLTRDAALNALKVSGASAVIDNVPVVGAFLGAFISAGDMMAITGIQMMLMLQIRATFGKRSRRRADVGAVADRRRRLRLARAGTRALGLHPGRRDPHQVGDRVRRHRRGGRGRNVLRAARAPHGDG